MQLGNGGTTGSVAGDVLNHTALVINRSDTITLGGAISGTGSVTQVGIGTAILTADNTYTGGTTISAGTLQLGNGGTAGSVLGDIVDNGVLAFNRGDAVTYAGIVSGTGSLVKSGAGMLTLTADQTYTGGTTINGGTLQLGDGGTTGWILGDVIDNGVLAFNRSDSLTYAGIISGTGALSTNGAGTLTLTGSNTYTGGTTINAGTLQLGDGGTSGSILGDVLDNGALVVNRSDAVFLGGTISGIGSFAQIGAGTTVLAGDNTYTGGTTISPGTLQIGNGGTTGSVVGDIVDNGALVFNRSDTLSFGGVISGTGSLTQAGPGTLILTGANTYTGGTTIAGGTLQVGTGGVTGGLTGNIVDNGALVFNHTGELTYSSVISGSGSLVKAGDGTLILNKNQLYTGGTTISGGTLQLGNGGAGGTVKGDIVDNGVLVFDRKKALTFGGVISGTGSVVKNGSNILTLTGNNSFTGGTAINAGILQIGNGGTTGSISGDIIDNAVLVFDRKNDLTYAGAISGGGSLIKAGEGTLTLTGNSTYTGGTTVEMGGLVVTGSIAGAMNVLPGAFLEHKGSIGSSTIGGTLAPGNSIGTLNVNGDLTFEAGSIFEVEVSPTASDQTIVSGLATLNGSVHIVSEPGAYEPGALYTILSAGSLSGTFAGLSSNFGSYTFLAPTLTYDTNNVYFSLARAATFASVGETPNQIATGAAADALGYDNTVVQNIIWGTAGQARVAFDALSGEIHASAASVLVEDSRFLRDAITGRARQNTGEGASHAWAQPVGARGDRDSDGNAAALSQSTAGLLGGLDTTLGSNWQLGVAGGYTRSWFDASDRASSGSSDNYHLAVYGGGQFGPVGLRLGAAHTWQTLETARGIAFSGFADTAAAEYDAKTTQVFGELGYSLALGRSAIEPFAGFAYVNVNGSPFAEQGGAAALTGRSRFDASFATLGVRGSTPLMTGDRMQLALRGGLGWRRALGDVTPEAALAFSAGGAPFTVQGAPIAKDALAVEAGIDLDVAANAKLSVLYDGQLSADGSSSGVKLNFALRF